MCVIIFQHDEKKSLQRKREGREYDDDDDDDDDDGYGYDDADEDGSTVNIDSSNNDTAGCVSCCLSVPFYSLMAGKCK